MKVCLILFFLMLSFTVKNHSGPTAQEVKKREIEYKIYQLKKKYPPDNYKWMYEITKSLKS